MSIYVHHLNKPKLLKKQWKENDLLHYPIVWKENDLLHYPIVSIKVASLFRVFSINPMS